MTDSAGVDAHSPTHPVDFSLPEGTGAIALAREFTRGVLAARAYRGEHGDVVLVVSELIANALRHGAGVPVLRLTGNSDAVRVEVADTGTATPTMRQSGPDGGFGLKLVERLGVGWGVAHQSGKKVVWCELRAEPAQADVEPRPTVA